MSRRRLPSRQRLCQRTHLYDEWNNQEFERILEDVYSSSNKGKSVTTLYFVIHLLACYQSEVGSSFTIYMESTYMRQINRRQAFWLKMSTSIYTMIRWFTIWQKESEITSFIWLNFLLWKTIIVGWAIPLYKWPLK